MKKFLLTGIVLLAMTSFTMAENHKPVHRHHKHYHHKPHHPVHHHK